MADERVAEHILKDHNGDEVTVPAEAGEGLLLLSFHPLAWTGICTQQMKNLEAAFDELAGLGVTPVGISVDSVPSKLAWAKDMGLQKLRILSDFWPHGGFAASVGLFREANGFSERANVIVNADGEVIFRKVYPIKELPDLNEILEFLRNN
jgi:peroxiredoxin